MKALDARERSFDELNALIRQSEDNELTLTHCCGQRYIASGLSGKSICIEGIPGNALGAYMDGCTVEVMGNAQDATGDTMNAGKIIVHGRSGDATGYAMRGGMILVEKNIGYRAGIHMKAYEKQIPVLIAGGEAGSFLGEYQAGGYIIVLGLNTVDHAPVGRFCAAGMHGGKIYLRTKASLPYDLPEQVNAHRASAADIAEIRPYIAAFCEAFQKDAEEILAGSFYVLTPDSANPYKRLYVTY